jgi:cytochrome bd-type quinol oxidase subunit 1
MILSTLLMYLVVYAALITAYIGVIFHLAKKAGGAVDASPGTPDRPTILAGAAT